MRKHNFAFIDIETTGVNVLEHELIEVGCVLTTDKLKVIEEFEFKIKPKHIESADPIALKVNHYSDVDWESAYDIEDAVKILSEKVKGCIMVGHNVAFDAGFLEYTFAKLKLQNSMHYHKLDTVSITWAKLHKNRDVDHFSLREISKYFDIKNERPHSALSDARTTFLLYKKLMSL